jgi:hypothetical protein
MGFVYFDTCSTILPGKLNTYNFKDLPVGSTIFFCIFQFFEETKIVDSIGYMQIFTIVCIPGLRAAASARNRLEPRLRNLELARAGLYYRSPSRGLRLFYLFLFTEGTCKLSRARTWRQIKLLEAGAARRVLDARRLEPARTGSNSYSTHYSCIQSCIDVGTAVLLFR